MFWRYDTIGGEKAQDGEPSFTVDDKTAILNYRIRQENLVVESASPCAASFGRWAKEMPGVTLRPGFSCFYVLKLITTDSVR